MKRSLRVLFSFMLVVAMSLALTTSVKANADKHPDIDVTYKISADYNEDWGSYSNGEIKIKITNNSKKKIVVSKYVMSYYNGEGGGSKPFKNTSGKNIGIASGKTKTVTVKLDNKDTTHFFRQVNQPGLLIKYCNRYYQFSPIVGYYDYDAGERVDYPEDHVYGHDTRVDNDGRIYDYWGNITKEEFKTGNFFW